MTTIRAVSAALCVLGTTGLAQEGVVQPVLSAPYAVADARAAMDEIMTRYDAAQDEQAARFSDHDGGLETFVRTDPVFQDVSWPDETCVDLVSLFPSPPEGWAIRSEWANSENPIGDDRGEMFYVSVPDVPVADPAFGQQQNTVTVRVQSQPPQLQLWSMQMENETMRELSFDEGPFGYPLMKYTTSTIVGEFLVDVTGTGDVNAAMFLERIIGCAIDNGLIGPGVDPATLTR